MADTYFQTAVGFGVVDDPANVPPGATIITQAAYDAGIAAWQTTQNNTATAEQASAEGKYVNAFKSAKSVGMTNADAQVYAAAVGRMPVGFDPVATSFTPLGSYLQSPAEIFAHALAGAAGVWEEVSEFDDLVAVNTGIYIINYMLRGQAVIPLQEDATTGISTQTSGAIAKNGTLIPNTETLLALVSQGTLSGNPTAQPSLQVQGSGGGSVVVALTAGDVLNVYGMRSGSTAGSNMISSGTDGRCRITAQRIWL